MDLFSFLFFASSFFSSDNTCNSEGKNVYPTPLLKMKIQREKFRGEEKLSLFGTFFYNVINMDL